MECQICGNTFTGHGHNARPVADGKCCDVCQDTRVLPTRMELILEESPAYQMMVSLMRDVGETK